MKFPVSRRLKVTLTVCACVALTALGLCYYTGVLDENLRTIAAGKCYRSGQMDAATLARTIKAYGIKCVLNLRGTPASQAWYKDEAATCAALGVEYATVPVHLGRLTEPDHIAALIARLEHGPYPLLLHCREGADRAGLASVLYVMVVEGKPLDEALAGQMTWRYGHLSLGPAKAVDDFFELYRRTAGGKDIKLWVNEVYPKVYLQITN